ncbi:MAG: hypothetical protein CK424_08475 [Legionella sp.]|nr:MAG: hypothetical protein CK424_08475 [Legionella sp.]
MLYSLHNLGNLSDSEIAASIAGIPAGVATLDFGGDFSSATPIQQVNIILSLPASITTIIMNGNEYSPAEYLLLQLFPLEARENFHLKERGETIQPTFAIDESMLIRIMRYFYQHPSSIGYLACGLLLEGRIKNQYDESILTRTMASLNIESHYSINRGMAAISLYRKAASDDLGPKIEFMLYIRSSSLDEDNIIKQELNRYALSPLRIIPGYNALAENAIESFPFPDSSDSSLPAIDDIFNKDSALDYWFLLKIGLAISVAGAAMVLFCLTMPLSGVCNGFAMVACITYPACGFFASTRQNNLEAAVDGLRLGAAV